jgi:hypothetical protein
LAQQKATILGTVGVPYGSLGEQSPHFPVNFIDFLPVLIDDAAI